MGIIMLQNMRGVHPKGVLDKRAVTGGIGGVGDVRPVLTEHQLQLRKLNSVSGGPPRVMLGGLGTPWSSGRRRE